MYKPEPSQSGQAKPARPLQTHALHEVLHDANQPLSIIIGLAELGTYNANDETSQADFNLILEEARKLRATLIKAREIILNPADNYAAD